MIANLKLTNNNTNSIIMQGKYCDDYGKGSNPQVEQTGSYEDGTCWDGKCDIF